MANVYQNPNTQNPTQQADTRNVGYKLPGQTGPWDSSPQNSNPNFNFGGNPMNGGAAPYTPSPFITNYMSQQSGENARSRAANTNRWNDASGFLKKYANPLSPDIIAKMKAMNAMEGQGAATNAFREQQGLLNQGGQGDAGSMAGAASEANRHGLGASVLADSKLETDAALANNNAGMQVGSTILGNLPQDRPTDYSGYAALGLADQNSQFQRGMITNQMDRPISPGMTNSRPAFGNGMGSNTTPGGGFNWMMPPPAPTSRLNSAGGMQMDGTYGAGDGSSQGDMYASMRRRR